MDISNIPNISNFQFISVSPVHISMSSSYQYLERETPCELAPAL